MAGSVSTRNYWNAISTQRTGRRQLLAWSGAGFAGAAFLAACGGSKDGDSKQPSDKSGLVSPIVDTSKQAKRGGSYKWTAGADTTTFDPHSTVSTRGITGVYSNLLQLKAGY